jgi:hypothetical protein
MLYPRQTGTRFWRTLFSKLEELKICAVPSGLGCLPHPPTRHFPAGFHMPPLRGWSFRLDI